MLEDYYVKPSTIDRVRSSWLAPQIESYLEWLQAHGYSRLVVYRRLPLFFHVYRNTASNTQNSFHLSTSCRVARSTPEGATEHGSCGLAELGMSCGDNVVTVPVIAS